MTVTTHAKFLAACKRFAVPVVEHSRNGVPWYRHNAGATFDAHVLGVHDTRHGGTSDLWPIGNAWPYCWDGRPGEVPGPLYLGLVAREDGRLHMIGWGKTNNAGKTSRAAVDRAWRGLMPLDRELPAAGADDYLAANNVVAGFAYVANGQPTAAQVRTMEGALAAYGYACGWTAKDTAGSVADHGELTRRKSDATRSARDTRRGVLARFANPTGAAKPAPAPAPAAVRSVALSGTAPVLVAGMADPLRFKGGQYVSRVQRLLGIPLTGRYDAATVAKVKSEVARLKIGTPDKSGRTVDGPVWERLYGIQ